MKLNLKRPMNLIVSGEEGFSLDLPDELFTPPEHYNLKYRKQNGSIKDYKVVSINNITNKGLIRCSVQGKGFRSFRVERILSFEKVN